MKGRFARKILAYVLAVAMLAFALGLCNGTTEYEYWVHYNTQDGNNKIFIEKPIFPARIFVDSIPIGGNVTIVCPLRGNHTYHVYCYGDWVHTGPEPKTDYDIYVFGPDGTMESLHTEAAGLPEHLGTTVDAPFFVPKANGNYMFTLVNDARESNGAEQATFMIIENIQCDTWYTHGVVGKTGSTPAYNTNWAYEFITDGSLIEVYIKVPDALDMYEARLYLMSDAQSVKINNVSLPWEEGLYGNGTGIGGYNMESESYRGVAYASCEFYGQDMYFNYTPATTEMTTYHLVLMGEIGSGAIEFLVKTSYGGGLTQVNQPRRITPDDETVIIYQSDANEIEKATLHYTINDWETTAPLSMVCDNRTCNATIPKQPAGSNVKYKISATDSLKNELTAEGEYVVKLDSEITSFNAMENPLVLGKNVTVTGTVSPSIVGNSLELQFMTSTDTQTVSCIAAENGTFTAEFSPTVSGTWTAQAFFRGTNQAYECESPILLVTVNEPTFIQKNGTFVFAGILGVLGAGGAVYYIRQRRSG